jgi:hypothetical protein
MAKEELLRCERILTGEDFKTIFPIGSYVKTTVYPLKAAILDGGQGHRTQF